MAIYTHLTYLYTHPFGPCLGEDTCHGCWQVSKAPESDGGSILPNAKSATQACFSPHDTEI